MTPPANIASRPIAQAEDITSRWRRPASVAELAAAGETYEDFGYHLKDFLHTIHFARRDGRDLTPLFSEEPIRLGGKFREGAICDAFLAGLADYFCRGTGIPAPEWARSESRVLVEPWFASPLRAHRWLLLRDTPAAFKERNIFLFEKSLTVV